ncbi:hypothetical protein TMatcc_009348 [Talaromyces marneffei ATCC 18224]|uniref:Uncharacterized protein n=3 Tax=Talaromyces marneffei TaxID=37727 RepID=B6QME4_TALMQ|nr:hypothetical protein PMAA_050640 [Talaromyces marneffei ATCC 18224]
MDSEEALDRPFRFLVTGQYIAVHYDGQNFELHTNHHLCGDLFYLSDDEEKIIHNGTYIGHLKSHSDYRDDVFYICRGVQYLSQSGSWTASILDALMFEIHPMNIFDDLSNVNVLTSLSDPVINDHNPISADGVDLYHPNAYFCLYPLTGDCLWTGDAGDFKSELFFGGDIYSNGQTFRLSMNDGKTRIQSGDRFLTVTLRPDTTEYLPEACRQHNAWSKCPKCAHWYSLGFQSVADNCFTLIPRGLPSMFVLYDGAYYHRVSVLKASYATTDRVERIEDASLFQFVSV